MEDQLITHVNHALWVTAQYVQLYNANNVHHHILAWSILIQTRSYLVSQHVLIITSLTHRHNFVKDALQDVYNALTTQHVNNVNLLKSSSSITPYTVVSTNVHSLTIIITYHQLVSFVDLIVTNAIHQQHVTIVLTILLCFITPLHKLLVSQNVLNIITRHSHHKGTHIVRHVRQIVFNVQAQINVIYVNLHIHLLIIFVSLITV